MNRLRAAAFVAALLWTLPASANFAFAPSGGTTMFAIDAANQGTSLCAAANVECAAHVNIDTAGAPVPALNVGIKGTPAPDLITVQGTQGSATAKGLAITTGGTSQTLLASNATRAGLMIQNPCSAAEQGIGAAEDLVLNLTNAATLTTSVNWVVLAPCGSISMGLNGGLVTTEAVTAIATTTAHVVYAKEF